MYLPQHLGLTFLFRPYSTWLDFVLAQSHLPLAISTSYGDDEQTGTYPSMSNVNATSNQATVPESLAIRVCAGFAQLGGVTITTIILSYLLNSGMTGARGISIMFSSGDNGVGDGDPNPATQKCFSNNGRNVTEFIPAFPASYVTFIFLSMVTTF